MSADSLWEHPLRDILNVINPSSEDWSVRFRIIDELRSVVQSVESLRGATVEPFGSFVSNLFTRWADLDISIELHNQSYISTAGKKHKQSLLGDVLRALRKKGGCHRLQFISNARVPILKFESNHMNISCDISINNLNGQMKSKLLFWINEIDGRFREMVLLVKEWAKAHDINDSKSGSLNSYSFSLLIIFHFQTCQPPILPPLREIYPGNIVDDLKGVRAVAEQLIEEACAVNINEFRSNRSRRINRRSLPELFISFLEKFCDINLRASEQGISPFNGQWEDIESNKIWLPKTYALFIEDPFEQPVNSARGVSNRQLMKIAEAFHSTHQMLTSNNVNQNSVMGGLVRPEVSQLLARTTRGNLDYDGPNYRGTHLQLHLPRNPTSNGVNHRRAHSQLQQNGTNRDYPGQHLYFPRNSTNNSVDHQRGRPQLHQNGTNNGSDPYRPPSQLPSKANNNDRDHLTIGPQVHGAGAAPAQVQHQSQIKPVHKNPNKMVTQRLGQVQQIWRPRAEK